jgi:hypothetical protein
MMILPLLLAIAAAVALVRTIRLDGYGRRPGPRSPRDEDRTA